MKMCQARQQIPGNAPQVAASSPALRRHSGGLLQRACACGGTPGPDGECAACKAKRLARQQASRAGLAAVPPIVHEVIGAPGRPLDATTCAYMEPRLGHDFSRVRIHTDNRAADSAQAVNALAFTVGRHVVFGAGQYRPGLPEGRKLLAHELTHTVQQGQIGESASDHPSPDLSLGESAAAERQAEATASRIEHSRALERGITRSGQRLMRQTAPACDMARVRRMQMIAAIRCQNAVMRLAGMVPGGPPRTDPAYSRYVEARSLAIRIFNVIPDLNSILSTIYIMWQFLQRGDWLPVVCETAPVGYCRVNDGFVDHQAPPIHLCPSAFANDETLIRTLIHESAHLAGIGDPAGESYCPEYDCLTPCGGPDMADSYGHYVHCLIGRPPDVPVGSSPVRRRPGSTLP